MLIIVVIFTTLILAILAIIVLKNACNYNKTPKRKDNKETRNPADNEPGTPASLSFSSYINDDIESNGFKLNIELSQKCASTAFSSAL